MKSLPFRIGLLVIAALVAGCTASPGPSPTSPGTNNPDVVVGQGDLAAVALARAPANPTDAAAAAAGINDFGLELFRVGTDGDQNAVVSPASIILALGMARPGARTETAAQMDDVMRAVASDENAAWLNALDAALAARSGTYKNVFDKDAEVTLRIANAAYGQRGFEFERAYLEALASRFGVGLRLVDYVLAPESARQDINAWVDGQTEHRIPELLEQGTIDELTRLVLVNAIYLKAPWFAPFEEEVTRPAPFHRLDGSVVEVPTMLGGGTIGYAEGDGWRAVELPYAGRDLAMTIIVPDDLDAFEASLSGERFAGVVEALEDQKVALWLPKFGIETKLSLAGVLADMGMDLAFDPMQADFSGISTQRDDLYITDVIHQANIDLDEEGTEAAAATAVVMGVTSAPAKPPVELRVDRPFLFALRDVPTGAILFLGRVVEPIERG
ncbi:MAG: serpin family protein [Chloroflexi bacterium]|nr:serpin family protein [Chloroflexota bacterium]